MVEKRTGLSRKTILETIIGVLMLAVSFGAIASSDVSPAGTHFYWSILVVVFGLICFAADRTYTSHRLTDPRSALAIFLHWLGVFIAIQLVYFFVASGRMDNAETGLSCGLILALGTFIAGAHGNWRLLVGGAALGAATTTVAYVEEYVWLLAGIVLVASLALVFGSHLVARYGKSGA